MSNIWKGIIGGKKYKRKGRNTKPHKNNMKPMDVNKSEPKDNFNQKCTKPRFN